MVCSFISYRPVKTFQIVANEDNFERLDACVPQVAMTV